MSRLLLALVPCALLLVAGVGCSSDPDVLATDAAIDSTPTNDAADSGAPDTGASPDASPDTPDADSNAPACPTTTTAASVRADTSYCQYWIEELDFVECPYHAIGRMTGFGYEEFYFDATSGALVARTVSTDLGTDLKCGELPTACVTPKGCAFDCFTKVHTLARPVCGVPDAGADGGADGG